MATTRSQLCRSDRRLSRAKGRAVAATAGSVDEFIECTLSAATVREVGLREAHLAGVFYLETIGENLHPLRLVQGQLALRRRRRWSRTG